MLRTMAEAFVAYDVGATSASSLLISAGCFLIIASLYLRRVMSLLPALFFGGLALVWAAQYHRVFNRLGFSLSEQLHWASLSLWFAGLGLFLFVRRVRLPETTIEVAASPHAASTAD
jgi:phosphatidylserine synthase